MKEGQKTPKPNIDTINEIFSDPEDVLIETPYPEKDDINHPDHYTMGIEVTDFIASWEMDWFRGNILKYLVRCPFKDNVLKDLKKAKWYLDDLIERVENDKYNIL